MARYTYTSVAVVIAAVCVGYTYTMPARWSRALDSPFGKDIQRCQMNWAQISQQEDAKEVARCLHGLLLSVTPRLREPQGLRALEVPRLDPLLFPDPVRIGGGPNDPFSGVLTNGVIAGVADAISVDASMTSYTPATKEFKLLAKIPRPLELTADYDLNIDRSKLFGQGDVARTSGRVQGRIGHGVAMVTVTYAKARNGELRVQASKVELEYSDTKLNFKGARADDPMTPLLNAAMSSPEASKQILELVRPTFTKLLASTVGNLYHRGWRVLDQL